MTKFMKFNPDTPKPSKSNTEFMYQVSENETLGVEPAVFTPKFFQNVVHLYFDCLLKLDVFMAWDEDITRAWIFYGTKGDEFE